jgi:hypothetical protein
MTTAGVPDALVAPETAALLSGHGHP